MAGVLITAAVAITAIFAPLIATHDPLAISAGEALAPPSTNHFFGTDDLGRDVFSRVVHGARISPLVGVIAIGLAAAIGTTLGLVSGYAGSAIDNLIMRFIDILLAFPGIVLAIAVVAILGPGLTNGMIAVGVALIPSFARVVRGVVLVEKEKEYVQAARLLGASAWRIVFKELLPSVVASVIVLGTLGVAGAILAGAGLSFLGLGAQLPSPEWGALLSQGRNYIATQWWLSTFPGIAIAVTVLGINLLGDGVRDLLDPRVTD
jgi:peptide/nickel transport system permease protein